MQIDTRKLKKLIIKAVPYVAFSYVGNLIGFAYRTAEGNGFQEKILPFMSNLGVAFARIFPSLHPFDLLFGLVLAGVMRLVLYVKSKNKKKFRQGEEYGSAVWGGEKDIEPYMDLSCPENNVILTKTESLTMGKPSAPKFARNKNILVIGGSGSGKTRFFVKPNLMQMHSSYVVTDPKGTVLVECGKMLERGRPKRVNGKVVYRRDDKGNYLKDKNGRYIPVYEPYKIKVFNTIDFAKSMHYNPFAYISKKNREKDILKFVEVLIKNTSSSQQPSGDDFWVKAEKLLYTAYIALIFASVLLLVALGGCFSEHSGVINIGLEGIMVMGALGGALMMKFLPAGTSAFVVVLLTVLASILLGMIYSLLLAVAAVNFKADQTLVGTAMNLLGTAAATVFVKAMNTAADPDNVSSTIQYLDGRKAFLVNIGGFEFNWCMLLAVIALVIAYVVLYKTRFGLRLCACGEHPQAADSVGINVYRMRYAGVLISGVLGGLGGIVYIIAGVSEWKFENGVAGFGFLALAVMIFGQWKPTRIALAALLFGFFRALGNVYSGFDLLSNLNLPSSVYNMLPYVISLVVLAFTSQKSRAPKAEGIPYDKGQR